MKTLTKYRLRAAGMLSLAAASSLISAATPADGTLSTATPLLTYDGIDSLQGNSSDPSGDGSTLFCDPDVSPCDDFALSVSVPADYAVTHPNAKIKVQLDWEADGTDWDLYLLDSSDEYVATSTDKQTQLDAAVEIVEIPAGAGDQSFTIRAVPFQPLALAYTATVTLVPGSTSGGGEPTSSPLLARFVSSRGWVRPGEGYVFTVQYAAASSPGATVTLQLPPSAYFESSNPAPASSSLHGATYNVGGQSGQIVVSARAASLEQDPEVIWKDLSTTAVLAAGTDTYSSATNGPRVTTKASARFGDRPFPVVNVQYADVTHCTGAGAPFPECTRDHSVAELDALMNSRDLGRTSVWQHFNDISLGQLNPQGTVSAAGKTTVPFAGAGQHKFARQVPAGTCEGVSRAGPAQPQGTGVDNSGAGGADGTPAYANRIVDGWYQLPGTQAFYGSDKYGSGLAGAVAGVGLIFAIDDGCGPTGKLAYDAASLADPDVDYNLFDTGRDGLVDFFEIIFAGCGGHGCADVTGPNNVWPHSSSLEFYFVDASGQRGYVSNDQLRNVNEQPLWWTTAARKDMTTTDMGDALKVFVRVGPYNVNPEDSFDKSSVISHEYGHSLGLPDFYSLGSRGTFGSWELMATDHSQYMTGYSRQLMGWLKPQELVDGETTIRESKHDTHSIKWRRPDGTFYELTGPDVHNADLFRVGMPNAPLIDAVPDGTRAMHSGAGNDFGCPPEGGHGLAISLPDLKNYADATAVTLSFKTKYEIEWDYDYGFVLASTDNGQSWTSLASQNGTTITGFNPNANACFTQYGNGITGVSGDGTNTPANPDRASGTYPAALWIDDAFDLTSFKGQELRLLLSYSTDPGLAKRGWFIDQLTVTVTRASGDVVLYTTSFEPETAGDDQLRTGAVGSAGWKVLSTSDGGTADHAYYLEARDRLSWDFNGRGQDSRANGPSFQAGLSMVYTHEASGFGNTDGSNPPHQSPVDATPDPGAEAPNLDDASFTLARPEFDGCTHVDNYEDPDSEDGLWHLPGSVKFTVTDMQGFANALAIPAIPATATIVADVNPDCDIALLPPELSIGDGYEDPDTDGAYEMTWQRPEGAVGPDTLQEATVLESVVDDDAESGLGQWTVEQSEPVTAPNWEASTAHPKPGATGTSFYANPTSEQQTQNSSATLTFNDPIDIPEGFSATLTFREWYFNEDDDRGIVEVSPDDGVSWDAVYTNSRPMGALPDEGAAALAEEALVQRTVDLSSYAGKSIRLRFKFALGESNYYFFTQYGWYVDDIKLQISNFADVLTTPDEIGALADRTNGTYYYRVRTRYAAGPVTVASAWSNVVSTVVDVDTLPIAVAPADFSVVEGDGAELDGSASGDADGDAVTYQWEQIAGPAVTLTDAATSTASFVAPTVCTDTLLRFRLSVANAGGTSVDEVAVTVANIATPPTADAGDDFTVDEGAGVMLSGSGTTDPDCDALDYSWRQTGGPVVTVAKRTTASPTFTAPAVPSDTPLTFVLTVTDMNGATSSDDITITVIDKGGSIVKEPPGQTTLGGGVGPSTLVLLGLLALGRRRRRSVMPAEAGIQNQVL
jgi:M6 family metalloprotease-like protein